MGFVREKIPTEKWEFVNKYAPDKKCSKYSIWNVDYEREAYWVNVGGNVFEHLDYYLLIWKGKKVFVDTYGWLDYIGDECHSFTNVILFQADASLEKDRDELVQIIQEALQTGYNKKLVIEEMVEPDFSREIK